MIQHPFKTLALAIALVAAPMVAQPDGHNPVELREAAMDVVGKSSKTIGDMLKGTTDFDAGPANAALVAMQEAMVGWQDLFPDGTAGAGSNQFIAAESIFSDRAGFDAAVVKFQNDLATAVAAAPQTKEALAASFGAVGGNCRSCHQGYRARR